MRGSVFKTNFTVFSREFESIETFPGFVQLLGENWVKSHKKYNNQDHIGKNLSNDKSLEVNVAISHKIFSCMIFTRKMTGKGNEQKS